jgi:hypothetical protein
MVAWLHARMLAVERWRHASAAAMATADARWREKCQLGLVKQEQLGVNPSLAEASETSSAGVSVGVSSNPPDSARIASSSSSSSSPSSLPAGWEELWDESTGYSYYYHTQTGTSVWERPSASTASSSTSSGSASVDAGVGAAAAVVVIQCLARMRRARKRRRQMIQVVYEKVWDDQNQVQLKPVSHSFSHFQTVQTVFL